MYCCLFFCAQQVLKESIDLSCVVRGKIAWDSGRIPSWVSLGWVVGSVRALGAGVWSAVACVLGVCEGQGSLACCSLGSRRVGCNLVTEPQRRGGNNSRKGNGSRPPSGRKGERSPIPSGPHVTLLFLGGDPWGRGQAVSWKPTARSLV